MATIFSRIISGEIPGHIVAENDKFVAFLDIMPMVLGHTLVVPKREVDYVFDMNDDELGEINLFARRVAAAIRKTVPCQRIGVAVIGLEVPHAHMHLIPMNSADDLNFTRPKLKPTQEELAKMAARIKGNLIG